MNSNLISVIVPVYKVEQYLNRCVSSIVKQTYTNLEIILVDDGSPDKCPQLCDEWALRDSRVKVVHKKNGGLSDARNAGLKIANGNYICFVDSDDYVSRKFVETLYELICLYHTDMSAVSLKKVYSMEQRDILSPNVESIVFEGEAALKELFSNDTFANYAWNKMYSRQLFDAIKFPVGKKMEDLGTTYKLLLKAKKIAYSTEILYYYYQRDDSILHTINLDFYRDMFELSRERYEMIQSIYPYLKENEYFYLKVLLETYSKLSSCMNDYDWVHAAKLAFEKCRVMVNLKVRIKYFLFVHCRGLYRLIGKKKEIIKEIKDLCSLTHLDRKA